MCGPYRLVLKAEMSGDRLEVFIREITPHLHRSLIAIVKV